MPEVTVRSTDGGQFQAYLSLPANARRTRRDRVGVPTYDPAATDLAHDWTAS